MTDDTARLHTVRRWARRHRWESTRGWPSGVAIFAILAAFWLLGGLWGVLLWVGVAGCWLAGPAILAVVVGQFGLVALAGETTTVALLPGEIALLALFGADLYEDTRSPAFVALLVVLAVTLSAVSLGLVRFVGVLSSAAGLALSFGLAAYLLHRYLELELGNLSDGQE